MSASDGPVSADDIIVLAKEPEFVVGAMTVRPAACEVVIENAVTRLEPRVMQVLVALAQSKGSVVSRDTLIRRCWSGVVVGDDAINRVIGRVRRLSEHPGKPFVLETVPKVGYRLSDSPASPQPAVTSAVSTSPRTALRLITRLQWSLSRPVPGLAAVLVLAAAGWGVWAATTGHREFRTAVLNFAAPAGDAGLTAFADGLVNEITDVAVETRLGTVPRDQLTGLDSAAGHRRAVKLGAAFVLDGDVRQEADQLIAAVRFEAPRTGTLLWSQQFEGAAAKPRDLRLRVAAQAVHVVRCAQYARQSRGGNISEASLAAYIRGCVLEAENGNASEIHDIMAALTRSEPQFAGGWGELAGSALDLADISPADRRPALMAEARMAAYRGRALDPRVGDTYPVLAVVEGTGQRWGVRARWLNEGLRQCPDCMVLLYAYGNFLRRVGALRDAATYYERSVARDPLWPLANGTLAYALSVSGRPTDAARVFADMEVKWPDNEALTWNRFRAALFSGQREAALKAYAGHLSFTQTPDDAACWRAAVDALTASGSARTMGVRVVLSCVEREVFDPTNGILLLAAMGKVDEAFALAAASADDDTLFSGVFFVPTSASLRRDPRFMPLMKRIGLLDYWRTSGQWPDFCSEPGLPFECKAEAARLAAMK